MRTALVYASGEEDGVKLYRISSGAVVEAAGRFHLVSELRSPQDWDRVLCDPELHARARAATARPPMRMDPANILAPVVSQEVWAAGVTYYCSRKARIEESRGTGGGDFYDRVYAAERPELFFKATGRRVVGPGQAVRIRSDAHWSVPEPELTLFANTAGTIMGCTIGNDMSSAISKAKIRFISRKRRCMPVVALLDRASCSVTNRNAAPLSV
ncbi:MAG TPA: hypothetical protein VM912_00015 [Terriglobales bacterium]|nr:hypothetical protein [Terriglobales bacterium]